jgi:hypothetical protein
MMAGRVPAVDGPGPVAAQHDRHRPGHGLEKDRGLLYHYRGHCHLRRHGIRLVGGIRKSGRGFRPSPDMKPGGLL